MKRGGEESGRSEERSERSEGSEARRAMPGGERSRSEKGRRVAKSKAKSEAAMKLGVEESGRSVERSECSEGSEARQAMSVGGSSRCEEGIRAASSEE